MSVLRATCACTSTLFLRAGRVVCASCGAVVVADIEAASETFATHKLPPDCKNADAFHRACRTGRVAGAVKSGRTWTCSASAWRNRTPAVRPSCAKPRSELSMPSGGAKVQDDLLAELGLRRRSA